MLHHSYTSPTCNHTLANTEDYFQKLMICDNESSFVTTSASSLSLLTVQPPGAITILGRTSTGVTFSFIGSPTGGARYEATFTSERSGIPQLGPLSITNTFYSASGLIPDVDYTLSIVAISGSERSTPVTVDVTTSPASKIVRVC